MRQSLKSRLRCAGHPSFLLWKLRQARCDLVVCGFDSEIGRAGLNVREGKVSSSRVPPLGHFARWLIHVRVQTVYDKNNRFCDGYDMLGFACINRCVCLGLLFGVGMLYYVPIVHVRVCVYVRCASKVQRAPAVEKYAHEKRRLDYFPQTTRHVV